jgi:O-acetyl-ADP-ribose deacetylase (regulator of RNase III)
MARKRSCRRVAITGSLEVADRLDTKSIAFPALRTAIYGFLIELAAQIAVAEVAPLGDI